jgi:hypothetical protein
MCEHQVVAATFEAPGVAFLSLDPIRVLYDQGKVYLLPKLLGETSNRMKESVILKGGLNSGRLL